MFHRVKCLSSSSFDRRTKFCYPFAGQAWIRVCEWWRRGTLLSEFVCSQTKLTCYIGSHMWKFSKIPIWEGIIILAGRKPKYGWKFFHLVPNRFYGACSVLLLYFIFSWTWESIEFWRKLKNLKFLKHLYTLAFKVASNFFLVHLKLRCNFYSGK